MRLIRTPLNIDFMGKKRLALGLSLCLMLASIVSLFVQGLNFGIDFTGGTLVEVGCQQAVPLTRIRAALDTSFDNVTVQRFGSVEDLLIRVAPQDNRQSNADISSEIMRLLDQSGECTHMRRVEYVGAQVGDELTEEGSLAMVYALIGILLYVTIRFQLRFSIGAIGALIHDVLITLGLFSITQMGFDLSVLAAILAVIGYSLNDTIVVFDRIRENFRRLYVRDSTISSVEVVNLSLNQTLSRTLMTSLTTLLVLLALFLLGSENIRGFSVALIIGVLIGSYSSIYVASPITLMLGLTGKDVMPVEKEGA